MEAWMVILYLIMLVACITFAGLANSAKSDAKWWEDECNVLKSQLDYAKVRELALEKQSLNDNDTINNQLAQIQDLEMQLAIHKKYDTEWLKCHPSEDDILVSAEIEQQMEEFYEGMEQ